MYLSHFIKYGQIDLHRAIPKYLPKHVAIPISSAIDQPCLSFFCNFDKLEKNYICCYLNFFK